jgi:hypothetical protein
MSAFGGKADIGQPSLIDLDARVATGIGALGLLGWRRKRKARSPEQTKQQADWKGRREAAFLFFSPTWSQLVPVWSQYVSKEWDQ